MELRETVFFDYLKGFKKRAFIITAISVCLILYGSFPRAFFRNLYLCFMNTTFTNRSPFFTAVMKGFSQVMLAENIFTGLLFLAGLFCSSVAMGAGAILGGIFGTFFAKICRLPYKNTANGLYGFNAVLVGAALPALCGASVAVFVAIPCASMLSTAIQHLFLKKNFPAYSLPFIFSVWAFFPVLNHFFTTAPALQTVVFLRLPSVVQSVLGSLGEVFFCSNWLSGLLFLAGLAVASRRYLFFGVSGALLGAALPILAGQNTGDISAGIFGYNIVLTALALSGSRTADIFWALLGSIFTFGIQIFFIKNHFLAPLGGILTFPFVVAVLMVLLLKKIKILRNSSKFQ